MIGVDLVPERLALAAAHGAEVLDTREVDDVAKALLDGRPPPPVDPTEKVARAIVRRIERPSRETSVGLAHGLTVLGFRALPGVFDRLVTLLMKLGGLSHTRVGPTPGNVFEPVSAGKATHGDWGARHTHRGGVGICHRNSARRVGARSCAG